MAVYSLCTHGDKLDEAHCLVQRDRDPGQWAEWEGHHGVPLWSHQANGWGQQGPGQVSATKHRPDSAVGNQVGSGQAGTAWDKALRVLGQQGRETRRLAEPVSPGQPLAGTLPAEVTEPTSQSRVPRQGVRLSAKPSSTLSVAPNSGSRAPAANSERKHPDSRTVPGERSGGW